LVKRKEGEGKKLYNLRELGETATPQEEKKGKAFFSLGNRGGKEKCLTPSPRFLEGEEKKRKSAS